MFRTTNKFLRVYYCKDVMTEEQKLVKACVDGDRRAQQLFFSQYFGIIMSLCIRYTHSQETARDLSQEVMLKVFGALEQFRGESKLRTWVSRIAINYTLTWLKREKRLEFQSFDPENPLHDKEDDHIYIEGISPDEVMRLISELPAGYRTVLNLYAIDGYSHAEISELLGISEGTSKSQLSKARALLKRKLTESNYISK